MQAISEDIYSVLDTVHGFSELVMGAPIGQIEGQCGLDQAGASALQGGAELLHESAHAINNGFIETRTLLECKNFNSIYITFTHDGKFLAVTIFLSGLLKSHLIHLWFSAMQLYV